MSATVTTLLEHLVADRPEWRGQFDPELVELAHQLDDADAGHVRGSCIGLQADTSTSSVDRLIQHLRTSRRCLNPVGLGFANGSNVVAACNVCEECRRFEAQVHEVRTREAIPDPVYTIVPEVEWSATVKRLKRHGHEWVAEPVEDGRLLVVGSTYDGPIAGPVEDLTAMFYEATISRDRKTDRRKASSSAGVRTAKAVTEEAFPPKDPDERGQLVGFFSPKLVGRSPVIDVMVDELEKVAVAAQVPHEREGTDIRLLVGRHDPRAEWFYQRIGFTWMPNAVPWYQGGPAPNPGEKGWEAWEKAKARTWTPFTDEPPEYVYDREAAAVYEEHWVA